MKVTSKFKTIGFFIAIGAFTFGCNQETVRDTNEEVNEAQAELSDEAVDANNDLDEFEAWVDTNTSRAETATKEEWAETRAEYRRREAELEANSADWDDETKREWEEMKADWNQAEDRVKERLGDIPDVDVDVDVDRQNN